jgi:hypothetical protein
VINCRLLRGFVGRILSCSFPQLIHYYYVNDVITLHTYNCKNQMLERNHVRQTDVRIFIYVYLFIYVFINLFIYLFL